ncbi:PQQ-dependent sugar dehydrogenase [Isosphaeraceae bacterium EP7]
MRSLRVLIPVYFLLGAAAMAEEKPFGLNQRLPWNDSRVVGSPDPLSPYKVERAFPKLNIKQPLVLLPEPGTKRLFILQHLGGWGGPSRILAIPDDQAASEPEQLLEVEPLVYGMVLHPNYEKNGYIYLGMNGQADKGEGKASKVVRYTVGPQPGGKIDPASRLLIVEWPSNGHDGIDVAFDNEGYLYASAGDGSSDSDANLTGQTLDDLLACIIRIDVDHPTEGRAYGIPKDNPFVDRPGARPEVWAYGIRNPWRMSYDRESQQLWAGNNGQDLWEQVYLVKKGGNYGWSIVEGSHPFHVTRKAGADPILGPAAEHSHSEFRSLTGGRVYRGKRLPELVGAYVYGDWSTGRVWGIKHDGTKAIWNRELVDTPFNITGFGTDHDNELYVIDQVTGFYRLQPTTEADKPTQPFPTKLSETGLFASVPDLTPHTAALPYEVVAPQWADGASMTRFIALTGMEKVQQQPQLNAGGAWSFPNGSVTVQTLSLDLADDAGKASRKRIETRLMVRLQGQWTGYSYRWNPEQTDAELVPSAGTADAFEVVDSTKPEGRREQIWRFPSRTECLVCHSRALGFVLGFSPMQLDRDRNFGAATDNQLRTFEHINVFEGTLPELRDDRPRMVDPYDTKAPLASRARSYLDVNCATCHVKEGGGNSLMQLGFRMPLGGMSLIDQVPSHDKFNLPDARLIAPGAPERSVLLHRISQRGSAQMPPLVSTEVDHAAVDLITDWIRRMPPDGGVSKEPARQGRRGNRGAAGKISRKAD